MVKVGKGWQAWSQTEMWSPFDLDSPLLSLSLSNPLSLFALLPCSSAVYLVTAGNLETWHGGADRRGSWTNTLEFLRRTPLRSRAKSSYRITSLSLRYPFPNLHLQLVVFAPQNSRCMYVFPWLSFTTELVLLRSQIQGAFLVVCSLNVLRRLLNILGCVKQDFVVKVVAINLLIFVEKIQFK